MRTSERRVNEKKNGLKTTYPQIEVGVQIEPVEQGSPERMHESRGVGVNVRLWAVARARDERRSRPRDCIFAIDKGADVASRTCLSVAFFFVRRRRDERFYILFRCMVIVW